MKAQIKMNSEKSQIKIENCTFSGAPLSITLAPKSVSEKLKSNKGRFISLSWKEGKEVKKVSAKITKVTPKMVEFVDINSYQVYNKMITSLV